MPFPCLPKLNRCCCCTRNLKVACVFIVIWSMLAISHSCGMLFWPACPDQYKDGCNPLCKPLITTMWTLFTLNIITGMCSFGFLLAIFLNEHIIFVEFFVLFGFLTAICMCCHAVIVLTMIFKYYRQDFHCTNPSDAIAHIIYCIVWCYFICIANSYSYEMRS